MSSLSASFTPSIKPISEPAGPTLLGPTRICMRATILRSPQIAKRVINTSVTKTAKTLITVTHQGSIPKAANSTLGKIQVIQCNLKKEIQPN